MNAGRLFYLCPICFEAFESDGEHHGHHLLRCDAGEPDSERRRPPMNGGGNLKSTAPRWFLEAAGWLPSRPPTTRATG